MTGISVVCRVELSVRMTRCAQYAWYRPRPLLQSAAVKAFKWISFTVCRICRHWFLTAGLLCMCWSVSSRAITQVNYYCRGMQRRHSICIPPLSYPNGMHPPKRVPINKTPAAKMLQNDTGPDHSQLRSWYYEKQHLLTLSSRLHGMQCPSSCITRLTNHLPIHLPSSD